MVWLDLRLNPGLPGHWRILKYLKKNKKKTKKNSPHWPISFCFSLSPICTCGQKKSLNKRRQSFCISNQTLLKTLTQGKNFQKQSKYLDRKIFSDWKKTVPLKKSQLFGDFYDFMNSMNRMNTLILTHFIASEKDILQRHSSHTHAHTQRHTHTHIVIYI